jgi:hypothetical protein
MRNSYTFPNGRGSGLNDANEPINSRYVSRTKAFVIKPWVRMPWQLFPPLWTKFEPASNHPLSGLVTGRRLGYRAATPVIMEERRGKGGEAGAYI